MIGQKCGCGFFLLIYVACCGLGGNISDLEFVDSQLASVIWTK
jgi:hypothetical protein